MKNLFAIAAIASMLATPALASAAPATVQLRVEGSSRDDLRSARHHRRQDDRRSSMRWHQRRRVSDAGADDDLGARRRGRRRRVHLGPDVLRRLRRFRHRSDRSRRHRSGQLPLLGIRPQLQSRPNVGGCQQQVAQADEVLFGYDFFSKSHLLRLAGPNKVSTGSPAVVEVSDGGSGDPIDGAAVGGETTNGDGKASLGFTSPGVYRLKAERADSVRSNVLEVCVFDAGSDGCDAFVPSAGPGSVAVKDSSAPSASIAGIRNGSRLRRGPRLLRGKVADAGSSGLKAVKLSLRRHRDGRCSWWSATAERFSGGSCKPQGVLRDRQQGRLVLPARQGARARALRARRQGARQRRQHRAVVRARPQPDQLRCHRRHARRPCLQAQARCRRPR